MSMRYLCGFSVGDMLSESYKSLERLHKFLIQRHDDGLPIVSQGCYESFIKRP